MLPLLVVVMGAMAAAFSETLPKSLSTCITYNLVGDDIALFLSLSDLN
jgi:hypothetical protein